MSDTLPPLELFIANVLAGLSLEAVAEDESQLSYIAALVGEEVRPAAPFGLLDRKARPPADQTAS